MYNIQSTLSSTFKGCVVLYLGHQTISNTCNILKHLLKLWATEGGGTDIYPTSSALWWAAGRRDRTELQYTSPFCWSSAPSGIHPLGRCQGRCSWVISWILPSCCLVCNRLILSYQVVITRRGRPHWWGHFTNKDAGQNSCGFEVFMDRPNILIPHFLSFILRGSISDPLGLQPSCISSVCIRILENYTIFLSRKSSIKHIFNQIAMVFKRKK